ncbi:MAG: ribose-phosphate pyrophosphokinase [Ruminococcus sp.]|nr:ribose-phosphate pyrophosphokinase [Ruminococcus sp.]
MIAFYTPFDQQRLTQANVINYPDGTLKIDLPLNITAPVTLFWRYEGEQELPQLIFTAMAVKENFGDVSLFMPYLPNARMDRVHSKSEVFTLKYFCKIINSLEFSKVTIVDVHSSVGAALLDRCENLNIGCYVVESWRKTGIDPVNDLIFFPDEGSFKRYAGDIRGFAHLAFGNKKRDWATGQILGLDICGDSPEGRNVFLIDDICSYGGTAYHSALKLKEMGAENIDLFFTHCENSIAKGELFKGDLIRRIYTTDSICTLDPSEFPKLNIIDIFKGFDYNN